MLHGRMQLDASTSSCQAHTASRSSLSSTHSRAWQLAHRPQTGDNSSHGWWHAAGAGARHVACAVATSDVDTQPPSGSSSNGDQQWASRLLQVGKKKRVKRPKDADPLSAADAAFQAANSAAPLSNGWPAGGSSQGWDADDEDDGFREPGSGLVLGPGEKRLPAVVRCFDTARISIKAGDGGAGCVSFRREPFVEHGGPNGGNGGRGGSVWAVADPQLNSLSFFRRRMHWRATNGAAGEGAHRDGAHAADLEIPVPPGTIIRAKDADEDDPPLAELITPGQRALLLAGGRGGRGNNSFKTGRNTAPAMAEKGEAGGEMFIDLELKVVADVGIVGIPNAGKSTLLAGLTAARPKIANYPFTTLVPNLGVCEMDFTTTVFADVPGLLEGAASGLGLGHEFLRHVQRCRALVHVVDGSSPDPIGDYKAINLELELFNPALKDKPQVVAYNKIDLPDSGDYWEFVQEYLVEEEGLSPDRIFPISAVTGSGVTELVRGVRTLLDEMGPAEVAMETNALNVTELPKGKDAEARVDVFSVELEEQGAVKYYVVEGDAVERFAQMTNWDYYEAVKRFQHVLDVSGINAALRARGIATGDTVVLGDTEFEWSDEQGEGAMYGAWLQDMKDRGVTRKGKSAWQKARS